MSFEKPRMRVEVKMSYRSAVCHYPLSKISELHMKTEDRSIHNW
jgi:hypothetical protein